MILFVNKSKIQGSVEIPGSKSHTIRALFIASLAEGISEIKDPLSSDDADSAIRTCTSFGAQIHQSDELVKVRGFGGNPGIPVDIVDVGNSGTTLRFAVSLAGLCCKDSGWTVLTGDSQIRKRPLAPLLEAVNDLGAEAFSTRTGGMAPVVVKGRMTGGYTSLDAVTSQFLSSLLICAPMLERDTRIEITRLNEVPYAEMTLWWLDRQKITYINEDFKSIEIKGGQIYRPFSIAIPGDFSSATFFAVLAAISGGTIELKNLDMSDPQGDKAVFAYLSAMGAVIEHNGRTGSITVRGGNSLHGIEIDMNATPDALPAMAVAACFAEGRTKLVNVPQARLKETDRINVMRIELEKMGAKIKELPDGLEIEQSLLKPSALSGHGDHRIVMALATAGLCLDGETSIDTAEAMNVTFPQFAELAASCGGRLQMVKQ